MALRRAGAPSGSASSSGASRSTGDGATARRTRRPLRRPRRFAAAGARPSAVTSRRSDWGVRRGHQTTTGVSLRISALTAAASDLSGARAATAAGATAMSTLRPRNSSR